MVNKNNTQMNKNSVISNISNNNKNINPNVIKSIINRLFRWYYKNPDKGSNDDFFNGICKDPQSIFWKELLHHQNVITNLQSAIMFLKSIINTYDISVKEQISNPNITKQKIKWIDNTHEEFSAVVYYICSQFCSIDETMALLEFARYNYYSHKTTSRNKNNIARIRLSYFEYLIINLEHKL